MPYNENQPYQSMIGSGSPQPYKQPAPIRQGGGMGGGGGFNPNQRPAGGTGGSAPRNPLSSYGVQPMGRLPGSPGPIAQQPYRPQPIAQRPQPAQGNPYAPMLGGQPQPYQLPHPGMQQPQPYNQGPFQQFGQGPIQQSWGGRGSPSFEFNPEDYGVMPGNMGWR